MQKALQMGATTSGGSVNSLLRGLDSGGAFESLCARRENKYNKLFLCNQS
jgi:hypothetical protein